MRELPHTHSCFVCGESNPVGLRLRFETDGQIVRARFQFQSGHTGFQQTIHGGITATVLDEIMVWACTVRTGRFSYCAELNVRYLRPARPAEDMVAIGELTANRRDKIFEAKGELRTADNTILASSTGKYLPIQDADIPTLMSDVVGDVTGILRSGREASASPATGG